MSKTLSEIWVTEPSLFPAGILCVKGGDFRVSGDGCVRLPLWTSEIIGTESLCGDSWWDSEEQALAYWGSSVKTAAGINRVDAVMRRQGIIEQAWSAVHRFWS